MILDVTLWLLSLLIAVNIGIQSYAPTGPWFYFVFAGCMQFALVWEHGYKKYLRTGRRVIFILFYALPFIGVVTLVAMRFLRQMN